VTPHPIRSTRSFHFTGPDHQAAREQARRHCRWAAARVTRPEHVGPVLIDLAGTAALVVIEQACTAGQTATAGSFDVEPAGALMEPGGYLA